MIKVVSSSLDVCANLDPSDDSCVGSISSNSKLKIDFLVCPFLFNMLVEYLNLAEASMSLS